MPAESDDWCADVRAVAAAMGGTLRRHPNAIRLVLGRTVAAPSDVAADQLIGALERAGLLAENPHIAAPAQVSRQSTAVADFNRGLSILLAGIR